MLGVISVLQAVILMAIGLADRPMPAHGAVFAAASLPELVLGITVLGLASMCLGLLVSAFVNTWEGPCRSSCC